MSENGIIANARHQGRLILSEVEAKSLLAANGIPVIETKLATTPEQAVKLAGESGYPVALKIISPQITHKSDIGGVKLGLSDEHAVRSAYDEITSAARTFQPQATIEGVSVQRMAEPGIEIIAGMTTDAQFGPVLMFGLGGVLVEVLKDVAFRIVPIEPKDATQMVREIQGFPVLQGYRGQPLADLAAIEDLLLKLSLFIGGHPEIAELDLNPVFAYDKGVLAVDARVVLSEQHQ